MNGFVGRLITRKVDPDSDGERQGPGGECGGGAGHHECIVVEGIVAEAARLSRRGQLPIPTIAPGFEFSKSARSR